METFIITAVALVCIGIHVAVTEWSLGPGVIPRRVSKELTARASAVCSDFWPAETFDNVMPAETTSVHSPSKRWWR